MSQQCKAMILTQYIGGKAQCKRKTTQKYCYQHDFLNSFTGYYIDRNFKNGVAA